MDILIVLEKAAIRALEFSGATARDWMRSAHHAGTFMLGRVAPRSRLFLQ